MSPRVRVLFATYVIGLAITACVVSKTAARFPAFSIRVLGFLGSFEVVWTSSVVPRCAVDTPR
jgi:hypothetical protein